ncbi:MAG: hypothetical protein KatS3mg059_0893 [Thermomicrobiales bacterium]|nr:MAG: hypothetical protein KatS3mg059_0893 [Thermomicrobiales bacterium]
MYQRPISTPRPLSHDEEMATRLVRVAILLAVTGVTLGTTALIGLPYLTVVGAAFILGSTQLVGL